MSASPVVNVQFRRNPRYRRAGIAIIAGIIVLDALLGSYVMREYFAYPRTDDAYVRANTVGIAPQASGTIINLAVHDNEHVDRGQLLFAIDPRPYQAELDLEESRLALANLEIDALDHAIASAKARETQAKADAAYDQQYLNRVQPLLKEDFVTANEVASARSKLAAARAAVEDASNQVKQAESQLGQYGAINARRTEAQAAVYKAKLNVGYCTVSAPFDGFVTNLNIAVGQYANEGKEVISLVDNRVWYVMANFRETFLPYIAPGMNAEVYLIGYPHRRFHGRVQGVGWALYQANGATIQGLPDVAPTLNWIRLAQRFPVRITLDDPDGEFPFRMGATAVVTILGK
ncbi:MAG TPA: efflux RND transporter periplasmic adaptor subunit [Candidatus Binataceae bacterium]|nr:efflux RND transporter periplasmic adaptor subunit [Candidatus Binataceae bacterium]